MSTEKIDFLIGNNFLIENDKLMFVFVEFMCDSHNRWYGCNACDALKFLKPIKEYFDKDISMEQKKFFFGSRILNNKDVFKKLFTRSNWKYEYLFSN